MELTVPERWRGNRRWVKAFIPNDAWKSPTPVGIYTQSLLHNRLSASSHRRRRRHGGHRPSNFSVLRHHRSWIRSLHSHHHHASHRLKPITLSFLFNFFPRFENFKVWIFRLLIDLGFVFFDSVLCPLYYYHQKHPVNYLLLGIFTLALAFAVGLTCAFTNGKTLS